MRCLVNESTYIGTFVVGDIASMIGNWVSIPHGLELHRIYVDVIEKKAVEQPKMFRLCQIKTMQPLKPCKKNSPPSDKLCADFNPETLDTCVVS